MTRSDLTTKLSLRMKVSKKEADKYLTAFLDAIMESLENGDRVVMQGFGSFHVNEHKARMAKKPITGEPIYLPLRKKPVFNAGKELRDIINGRAPVPSSKGKRTPARVKEPRSAFDNVHGIQQQINMPE